jgi:hypothetical protein
MSTEQPNVILRGGPDGRLANVARVRHVDDFDNQLKILNGRCYEHFLPTPDNFDHEGRQLRVFAWSHRTYVAE